MAKGVGDETRVRYEGGVSCCELGSRSYRVYDREYGCVCVCAFACDFTYRSVSSFSFRNGSGWRCFGELLWATNVRQDGMWWCCKGGRGSERAFFSFYLFYLFVFFGFPLACTWGCGRGMWNIRRDLLFPFDRERWRERCYGCSFGFGFAF
ncbi:hypothetical protein GGI35DRAFT_140922 [Trichoderma velutinum]